MKKTNLFMRIVMILILTMTAFGGFAACGKKADANEIYLAAHEGAYGKAFWAEIKNAFEAQFEKEGYKLRFDASSDIATKIKAQMKAGEGPDVIYLGTNQPDGFTNNLISSNSLSNLSALLDEKVPGEDVTLRNKIKEGFLDTTATQPYEDGRTMMLPLFYSLNGLYYNKDLVDESNLPNTWAQLGALRSSDPNKAIFSYTRAGYLDNLLVASLKSALPESAYRNWLKGFAIENPITEQEIASAAFDHPKFKQLFTDLATLKPGFDPLFDHDISQGTKDAAYNTKRFYDGNIAFFPNGSFMKTDAATWQVGTQAQIDSFSREKVGFIPYPSVEEGDDRYSVAMLEQIYVPTSDRPDKQAIAKKFVSFMFSDKAVRIVARHNAMIPINGCETIAEQEGMDSFVLDIFGKTKDTKVTADQFLTYSVNKLAGNSADRACYGMNKIMGVNSTAYNDGTVTDWIRAMKELAVEYTKLKN